MLAEQDIKSRVWDEALNAKYGWMMGGSLYMEVGGGWRFVIEDLLKSIDLVLSDDDRDWFRISQIKEKYGSLSVYHNGEANVERLVNKAGSASVITCDVCAGQGRPQRSSGWIVTRCRKHLEYRG